MTQEQLRLQAEARERAQGANQAMREQARAQASNPYASQVRQHAGYSPEYAFQVENHARLRRAQEMRKNIVYVGGAVVVGALVFKLVKPKKKGRK